MALKEVTTQKTVTYKEYTAKEGEYVLSVDADGNTRGGSKGCTVSVPLDHKILVGTKQELEAEIDAGRVRIPNDVKARLTEHRRTIFGERLQTSGSARVADGGVRRNP